MNPKENPARILVVDDERIVAEDIGESLQHMGHEIVGFAQSGPGAIEKALSLNPDLVMMDIVLQGEMDGIEAATVIRERLDTPCVFLTAYSDSSILERAKSTEPAGYIVKPFEEAGLRSTVEIALYKVKAERALRESREWFSTTLMSIGDGVVATDAAGKVQFMNPAAETMTGHALADANGLHIDEIYRVHNEETREKGTNPALEAILEGVIVNGDKASALSRPDKTTLSVDHSGAPIRDQGGKTVGAVLIFRDVTQSRKAEGELRQYKDHLEELVHERTSEIQEANTRLTAEVEVRRRTERALEYRVNMQDLVGEISAAFLNLKPSETEEGIRGALECVGNFVKVSAAFLFEYAEDGQTVSLSHLWCQDERLQRFTRFFQNLACKQFPWWQLQANGEDYIYVRRPEELPSEAFNEREILRSNGLRSILAVPMREGSRLVGFFGLHCTDDARRWVKEDITFLQMCSDILLSTITRKRTEDEKERLQQQLAHSQKMEAVGKLSGGIAHDFNNMLLPIIGYSDMLLDTCEADDVRAKDILEIRKAAQRAAALTRQLLAFSRKQVISKTVFDLNETIVGMENMLKPIIGEDVDLVTETTDEERPVKADLGQVEQVIMNLVINARDSMPSGGNVRIRTGTVDSGEYAVPLISEIRPRGAYVYIEVEDDGCGMEEELIERIFDPFYTTKGLDGTGLGLSVVYGILEQHKGGISVESEKGKGSVFRAYLPAATSEADRKSRKAAEASERAFKGQGQRILLVEDEEGVSRFVSEALRQNGYEVTPAASIREAQRMLATEKGAFDLVFSDAVLPDGNGIELLDQVLTSNPEVRGLLSSGYTDKHNVNELIKQRPISFLQKPYSLPVLVRTVGEIMEHEPVALSAG